MKDCLGEFYKAKVKLLNLINFLNYFSTLVTCFDFILVSGNCALVVKYFCVFLIFNSDFCVSVL
ncbi:unnamed protein product [Meloidogyne enterolobii]|uniref:Uncharacterized protein n=1 Tax=Meloidogyne enterolobii TaxID=390850 RepID=A0ACB1AEH4_MELEN